jgi:hypothetical protein
MLYATYYANFAAFQKAIVECIDAITTQTSKGFEELAHTPLSDSAKASFCHRVKYNTTANNHCVKPQ